MYRKIRNKENATEFDDWRHAKEDQILFSTSTFYYYRYFSSKTIIKVFQEMHRNFPLVLVMFLRWKLQCSGSLDIHSQCDMSWVIGHSQPANKSNILIKYSFTTGLSFRVTPYPNRMGQRE